MRAVAVARLLCSAYVRVQTLTTARPSVVGRASERTCGVEQYSASGRGKEKYHNETGWAERFDDRRARIYYYARTTAAVADRRARSPAVSPIS